MKVAVATAGSPRSPAALEAFTWWAPAIELAHAPSSGGESTATGTHGRARLADLATGPVAARVVASSKLPVLRFR
ncbi:hypothetical protein BURK1_02576 [Burkholderiales bacterium]|nr:hypothetical protein BURK1_02576 [Burkholderiales bacterium]